MPDLQAPPQAGLPVMELETWSRAVEAGSSPGEVLIRQAGPVTRAVDEASRTITIAGGTSAVDRYRDRIIVSGYNMTQFQRNPIVPWCHSYWEPPVATALNPRIQADEFLFEARFVDADISDFAEMLWRMYSHPLRFMRMASVGGMPVRWQVDEERRGMDILEFDLWEVSLCPLGVNPDALAKAKLNGISLQPMDAWARRCLDEADHIVISKPRAEALVRVMGYGKGMALFELEPEAIVALKSAEAEPAAAAEPEPVELPAPVEPEPVAEAPASEEPAEGEDSIEIEFEDSEEGGNPASDDEYEVDLEELTAAIAAAAPAVIQDLRASAR